MPHALDNFQEPTVGIRQGAKADENCFIADIGIYIHICQYIEYRYIPVEYRCRYLPTYSQEPANAMWRACQFEPQ